MLPFRHKTVIRSPAALLYIIRDTWKHNCNFVLTPSNGTYTLYVHQPPVTAFWSETILCKYYSAICLYVYAPGSACAASRPLISAQMGWKRVNVDAGWRVYYYYKAGTIKTNVPIRLEREGGKKKLLCTTKSEWKKNKWKKK